MYFITCFDSTSEFGCPDDSRTFGFFSDTATCKTALNENWCDMRECCYDYAVVERIEEGIHPRAEEICWYKWNNELQGFYEITKRPKWAESWCNFALG